VTQARRQPRTTIALALAFYVATMLYVLGGFGGIGLSGASAQYEYGKAVICHRTGSAKNPFVTITVSENAVDAHRQHGDTIGPCPD
jgi:hypothetical protein